MSEHRPTHALFAKTTQSHIASDEQPHISDFLANIGGKEHNAAKSLRRVKRIPTSHHATTWSLICGYIITGLVLVWLAWLLWRRFSPERRFDFERICVHLDRHAVRPRVPAIDSAPGGHMEPFAVGWLAFDRRKGEIEWDIEDSLGVEPHDLVLRGPLTNTHNDIAPVFFTLGLQRNARMHLAGVAMMNVDKIDIIEENIENSERRNAYYISMTEKLIDGTVRELVRGRVYKKCAWGVE